MARLVNGILGGFSGKVGTVVGVIIDENCFIRGLPRKRTKFTANELENQKKLATVQAYLDPLIDLLKVGFNNYYTKTGGFRAAVSYFRKNALVSDDAGHYIDPALAKISGGDLLQAINPSMVSPEPGKLLINWDTTDVNSQDEADQLMVLLYDVKNSATQTKIFNGAFRRDGSLSIAVKPRIRNKELDVYIGFVAADRSSQSDSQYLGKIIV
ncbi:hypothetical protein EZ428_15230 [Pedobacter frigiditerrae]|uniref:Uncharacterized protein n=1 Tax=Pedobacter frigiditerrae TaxID=2530452 RepID=A0A4V2MI50_9SPHI|nr:DUF6266 family protein [Pedobacter frigiditerrae]TCC89056.1 hypothetical protein EZ428_15230 [Pedobacter frigiditerrae]